MSNAKVLVVDDEADIRALIQEILSEEGYGVTVAANAEEARSARRAASFDLILLDIWMPDTDGITLLREWSEAGDLKCPVVIMSGHGTVDTAVQAVRLLRAVPALAASVLAQVKRPSDIPQFKPAPPRPLVIQPVLTVTLFQRRVHS